MRQQASNHRSNLLHLPAPPPIQRKLSGIAFAQPVYQNAREEDKVDEEGSRESGGSGRGRWRRWRGEEA